VQNIVPKPIRWWILEQSGEKIKAKLPGNLAVAQGWAGVENVPEGSPVATETAPLQAYKSSKYSLSSPFSHA